MNRKSISICSIIFQSIIAITQNLFEKKLIHFFIVFVFITSNTIFFYFEIYSNIITLIPYSLLLITISSVIAVNIHRLILINNQNNSTILYSFHYNTYLKYIIFSTLLIFFDILMSTIIISYLSFMILLFKNAYNTSKTVESISHLLKTDTFVSDIFEYFIHLPAHYVSSRLVLILPCIAINQKISFKKLWDISRKNGLRLLILVHFLPWLFFQITAYTIIHHNNIIRISYLSLFNIIAIYIMTTILSISYKYIREINASKI